MRFTLAYSDALLGMGLLHTALRSVLGVFAAMNAQLVLLSLLSFAGAYALLARGFAIGVIGSTVGAYFFAFSWPRFAQLVHVQLQFTFLLPVLALLALQCGRDGRTMARGPFAWRAGAFVTLLALLLATTLYYAVFLAIGLSAACVCCLAYGPSRSHLAAVARRHAAALAGAALLAVLLIGPVIAFYLPFMRESKGRLWPEVVTFLVRPGEFLWMGRENWVWGGLFARWPEATLIARWPELRIGVGAVATATWLGAAAWAMARLALGVSRRRVMSARTGILCLAIVTGLLLQALMLRVGSGFSLWWAVWRAFPGAAGIRAVARLQLLVTLPMAVAFAAAVDAALRPGRWRPALAAVTIVLVGLGAAEQVGRAQEYSGAQAEALAWRVGDALPRSCKAAYVVATPDLVFDPGELDPAHFDAASYLAANPDVAAAWRGTAWEHYAKFGRAEHRSLSLEASTRHRALMFFYNYTIPLAASLAGVPVANGLSGWQPPGWDLFDVLAPDARERLAAWLTLQRLHADDVCIAPVRLDFPMLPGPPSRMLP